LVRARAVEHDRNLVPSAGGSKRSAHGRIDAALERGAVERALLRAHERHAAVLGLRDDIALVTGGDHGNCYSGNQFASVASLLGFLPECAP